jgi:glycosyltransferase involved in cell wall biosynthesis
MTRVLHVIPSIDPKLGGTTTALVGMAMAQKRAGLAVTVATMFHEGEDNSLGTAMQAEGITLHRIGPSTAFLQRHPDIVPTLSQLIPQHDVVHIHALWEEIQHQAARLSRKLKKPYVFTPHGMLDPWSLSQSRLKKTIYMMLRLRRNLNGAAAIHYTASTERDLVLPLKLKPKAIIEPNGIELGEFENLPDPGEFRAKFPAIGNRRIVLFLSRVHPKKGLDLLIPAWAKMRRDDAVLVIAGPDNDGYGPTLNAMIAQHGLEKDVIQTGILKGRARIEAFTAAEMFVLPSYQENFGIVVVESLACNCPVIISDQVNIHQEISAAGVGEVVPTHVDPLAGAMARHLENSAAFQKARHSAHAFAVETYGWEKIARRWISHYQSIGRR